VGPPSASPKLLRVLSRKPERANGLPGFVHIRHSPLFQNLPPKSLNNSIRPMKCSADFIEEVRIIMDVKEVAGHARQCASPKRVALT
jgi:hypothetical protein